MMNIIRADIYRMTREQGIHINFIVNAVSNVILMVVLSLVGMVDREPTMTERIHALFSMSAFALIGVVPIFNIVAAPIFRDRTVKNEVTWGMSRTSLYVARLITITVLTILIRITFVGTGTLTLLVMHGFADVPPGFWASFFQIFTLQTFMFIAAAWLGVFIVFSIENTFAVVEIFGGLMFAPTVLANVLDMFNVSETAVNFVRGLCMVDGIQRLANLEELATATILTTIALGMFWLVVPTIAGISKFKTAEVK